MRSALEGSIAGAGKNDRGGEKQEAVTLNPNQVELREVGGGCV